MGNNINNIIKLNLGCGTSRLEGYINIDVSPLCYPDIIHDISLGLPTIGDNSTEEIIAFGVLQMIGGNTEFRTIMNEMWRVLKPDGQLLGQVPAGELFGIDPFDQRLFREETFRYFNKDDDRFKVYGANHLFRPWHNVSVFSHSTGAIEFKMQPYKNE